MESRRIELLAALVDIERQIDDPNTPHSDQKLLDDAWEDINGQLEELDDVRECPCCTNEACVDCGQTGHMNHGTRCGASVALCDICVSNEEEDTRGCGNCAGCAYCMVDDGYDQANEV